MTDSWQCDLCGRHFTGPKNRIQLERKVAIGPNPPENIPYLDLCIDCESYDKKRKAQGK
jgi:hypothetical protein